jgi:ribosomal protein S18 acetylase RimI-like enzyme
MRPVIRTASPHDLADVVALLGAQFGEHDIDVDDLSAAALGLLEEPSRGAIFLAEVGGARVGIAVLAHTWTLEHGGPVTWLDELYVVPSLRGAGIGSALLEHAIAAARAAGMRAVDLEVDAAHARAESLYARQGFERLPRARFALTLER